MTDETAPPPRRALPQARAILSNSALALIAVGFAWSAPQRNGWAAAALLAALALDGLGLAAGHFAARRLAARGLATRPAPVRSLPVMEGLPSVVLAIGPGSGIGAALCAVAALIWPTHFPLIASALAGLIAMAGLARLALARIVMRLKPPQSGAPAPGGQPDPDVIPRPS